MSEYDDQANKFLADTGTTITIIKLGTFPYFEEDTDSRDVFYVTLTRGAKVYSFKFGDSLNNAMDRMLAPECSAYGCRYVPNQAMFKHTNTRNAVQFYDWCKKNYKRLRAISSTPEAYSILACLTKYDPGTFKNFCGDYGYDTDSMKAMDTYKKIQDEWDGVCSLFNAQELEQLAEIN